MGSDQAGGSTLPDPVAISIDAEPAELEREFDLSSIIDADPNRETVNTGARLVGEAGS